MNTLLAVCAVFSAVASLVSVLIMIAIAQELHELHVEHTAGKNGITTMLGNYIKRMHERFDESHAFMDRQFHNTTKRDSVIRTQLTKISKESNQDAARIKQRQTWSKKRDRKLASAIKQED